MPTILEQKQKMIRLIKELNQATIAYDAGSPIISDKEWDDMYFELVDLEKEAGEILPNSPTHSITFEVVTELKKVEHNHPMLSLDKTKDIKVIESFLKGHDWVAMAKMDGLTCSLHYLNGKLISAETRGNGIIGEDITHNAMVIPSIPKTINQKEDIIIDGEIICTYKNFEKFKDIYKNPRNFASGSIRLLNSRECFDRHLTFVAWDVVKGGKYEYLSNNLSTLRTYGFEVVPMFIDDKKDGSTLEEYIDSIKLMSKEFSYPIDGVVFKYDTIKDYNDAGRTDHHFKGGIAYKFYDETYSTRLRYISWTMGRTGVLTPVAIFDPVEIDGTEVSRASLHNVSIMKETLGDCAYVGEPLEIYKSNMIIPQIYSAGPKYDYGYVVSHGGVSANDAPEHCPICGGDIAFREENNIVRAYCDNPNCEGKLINRLDHFCGKKGLDIKGLSKATLGKLIDWGWIESLKDIFKLQKYRNEWIKKSGFGTTSVDKILTAIEKSKNCTTSKFIVAIGIPLIGKVASEDLIKVYHTYNGFRYAIDFPDEDDRLYNIKGIGEAMIEALTSFDYTEADEIFDKYINEVAVTPSLNDAVLDGKVFVITGKIKNWKNRDELKSFIESKGGKVTGSVTSKTSYLINNDTSSKTAKNLTAIKLNVPIINEDEFLTLVTPPNEDIKPNYLASAT